MAVPRVVAEKYELGVTLGRGGMGDVYEATEVATGGRVAIKIMRGPDASADDGENENEWAVRFEREVRAIRGLSSPHVIELLDAGVDKTTGERFLVMERLDGEDLSDLLKRIGPLPVALALRIAAQTCLGLERAHAMNIVHRDIKPGNLFLARAEGRGGVARREIRVLDFGIARMGTGDEHVELTELTRTGSMLGSPHYMSPEQARGSKSVDARADIWSLGVVLYRLLTGVFPHQDSDSGIGELLIAVCCKPTPSIQERAPWVPLDVARIVHRALLIKREDRFASAREMYEALVALLPDGSTDITESSIVPIDDSARNVVAPRATFVDPGAMSLPESDEDSALAASGSTRRGLDRKPSRIQVAVGGSALLLAAIGLVLGGVALTRRTSVVRADESFTAASTPRPEPESAFATTTITSVSLRVPRNVRVVVDGVAVSVASEKVLLTGALGSTHSVTAVADDGGERFETVVITADGALPPSIAAPAPFAPARSTVATPEPLPSRPSQQPRPVRVDPTAPSAAPALRTNFE